MIKIVVKNPKKIIFSDSPTWVNDQELSKILQIIRTDLLFIEEWGTKYLDIRYDSRTGMSLIMEGNVQGKFMNTRPARWIVGIQ